jgi:hypothetical protein
MPDPQHLDPGQPAPVAGYYRVHDASGTGIERVVSMREGELLLAYVSGLRIAELAALKWRSFGAT